MGLAVLPAWLKEELSAVAELLAGGGDLRSDERTAKHADWAEGLKEKYTFQDPGRTMQVLKEEVGRVFEQVLTDAGVYKCTPQGRAAFLKFIGSVGGRA